MRLEFWYRRSISQGPGRTTYSQTSAYLVPTPLMHRLDLCRIRKRGPHLLLDNLPTNTGGDSAPVEGPYSTKSLTYNTIQNRNHKRHLDRTKESHAIWKPHVASRRSAHSKTFVVKKVIIAVILYLVNSRKISKDSNLFSPIGVTENVPTPASLKTSTLSFTNPLEPTKFESLRSSAGTF